MSLIRAMSGSGGGSSSIDFTQPVGTYGAYLSYNSGSFSVQTTQKAKYIFISMARNSSYIGTLILDVDNETVSYFVQSGGMTPQPYNYFISSVSDNAVTFASSMTTWTGSSSWTTILIY